MKVEKEDLRNVSSCYKGKKARLETNSYLKNSFYSNRIKCEASKKIRFSFKFKFSYYLKIIENRVQLYNNVIRDFSITNYSFAAIQLGVYVC